MERSRLLGAVCIIAFNITYVTFAHSAIIDQQNINNTFTSFCSLGGACTWQQEVVAGVSGTLTGLDIYLSSAGLTGKVDIWLGSPWQSGAPIVSKSYTSASGATYIDLSGLAINLNINDSFTFGITANDGWVDGNWSSDAGGNYPAGDLHNSRTGINTDNTVCFSDCGSDLAFRSYMTVVPNPPALWLFGTGLLGLIGIARKKAA